MAVVVEVAAVFVPIDIDVGLVLVGVMIVMSGVWCTRLGHIL